MYLSSNEIQFHFHGYSFYFFRKWARKIQTWVPIPEKVVLVEGKCWTVTIGGGGDGVWDAAELLNESLLFWQDCSSVTEGIVGGRIWYKALGWFWLLKRLICEFNGKPVPLKSLLFEFIWLWYELFGRFKVPKFVTCWSEWPGPIPIIDEDPLIFKEASGLAKLSLAEAINRYSVYQFTVL